MVHDACLVGGPLATAPTCCSSQIKIYHGHFLIVQKFDFAKLSACFVD